MTKVFFIFFCLAILLSCESNRKTCWTCTTTIVFVRPGQKDEDAITSSFITEKCNMSKKEAHDFELRLTSVQSYESYRSSIAITECVEKKRKENKIDI
jgi:hypothetical protein